MLLSPRQIHLDFHTSELIPGIGSSFDAKKFAKTAKDASISSVTVFARCHHGWMYYDSKRFPECVHPNLVNKNMLVEQVNALHAEGVRAPVYITVQWDYRLATTRPEWLIRKADGSHEGDAFTEPGFYQSLCVNTGYTDFLKQHVDEVCELLGDELDGIFFDIVGVRPCLCAACRKEMKQRGIDASDDKAVRAFAKFMLDRFKLDMTEYVRARNQTCTLFYNAGHVGPCTRNFQDAYTHFELESLPSGGWGYLHFPVTARYARKLGLDCMGMTGKFHTSWGDFHSLKNLAALEFEVFRMLSYGFACSIGDQLEPYGVLNPATYKLIGQVYGPFAAREAWARPSTPLTEVALITSEDAMVEHKMPDSVMGAAQLLEELAVQFDILDDSMDLCGYKLVILPDDFRASAEYQKKLDSYVESGGKLISANQGGMNAEGEFPSCFPAAWTGLNELFPDFLIAEGALAKGLEPENEYAVYLQGGTIALKPGAEVLMSARAPYFARKGDQFCSHRYTPSAKGEAYPSVAKHSNVIQFAHPLFTQYRECAPNWIKTIVRNALDLQLPNRLVTHDGASTISIQLLDQPEQNRTTAHILSYIPCRKSAQIDIVEERTSAHNLTLTLNIERKFTKARLVPEGVELPIKGNQVTIPEVDGYAIVELS